MRTQQRCPLLLLMTPSHGHLICHRALGPPPRRVYRDPAWLLGSAPGFPTAPPRFFPRACCWSSRPGHPALFHRLAAPLHVLQDERREVGFLPSLRGGEPVRHRSKMLVQPPGGGPAPAGWGAPFGKRPESRISVSANQQRKRLPRAEEVRRKLEFSNSPIIWP